MSPSTPAWRLVHAGFAVEEAARAATRRAVSRLAGWLDTDTSPFDGSGLRHESGSPRERAARLVGAIDEGRVAVLVGGHGTVGMTVGDPVVAQILPHLPDDLSGCIIGSMSQAHVLTFLAARYPRLLALLGPPVLEVVGNHGHDDVAEEAVKELVELWRRGPPPGMLTRAGAYVGSGFWHSPSSLGEWTKLETDVIRPGTARGRVMAANLGSTYPWPELGGRLRPFDDVLLFCEVGHHRVIDVDHILQRLRCSGVLGVIRGLFIGHPFELFESTRGLRLHDIVARATRGQGYPVALGGFVGTGFPSPLLQIGGWAEVSVDRQGIRIRPGSPTETAT